MSRLLAALRTVAGIGIGQLALDRETHGTAQAGTLMNVRVGHAGLLTADIGDIIFKRFLVGQTSFGRLVVGPVCFHGFLPIHDVRQQFA